MEQNNNSGQVPEIIEASGWRYLEDYGEAPFRVDKYIHLGDMWIFHAVENNSGEAMDEWMHDMFHYPDTPSISETKEAAIEQHEKEDADNEARIERMEKRQQKDIEDVVAYIRSKFPELDSGIMDRIVRAVSGIDNPYIQGEKWVLEQEWVKERMAQAWSVLDILDSGGLGTIDNTRFIPLASISHASYIKETDTSVVTVNCGEKFNFKGKKVYEVVQRVKKIFMA